MRRLSKGLCMTFHHAGRGSSGRSRVDDSADAHTPLLSGCSLRTVIRDDTGLLVNLLVMQVRRSQKSVQAGGWEQEIAPVRALCLTLAQGLAVCLHRRVGKVTKESEASFRVAIAPPGESTAGAGCSGTAHLVLFRGRCPGTRLAMHSGSHQ